MPTSLFTIAAILKEIGIEVQIIDENIVEATYNNNIVGINLLGAPYIPSAIKIENKLSEKYGNNFSLLLGGQVVSGLSEFDFNSLFSGHTLNGNLPENLSKIFNIKEQAIPKKEDVSLINIFESISPNLLKLYLTNEFGFYLSQGCKHSCTFCAANRTITQGGMRHRVSEIYRNINIALGDFEYIIMKSISFNIGKLNVYLSNLDLFQNPLLLVQFAEGIIHLRNKYSAIQIRLRGLSTSRSFLNAHKNFNYVIHRLVEAGLEQIGFGIDGATPKVYKETRKPQSVQESLDVVRICKENYNITPEILMVFGHNNLEDEVALNLAVQFCKDMTKNFDAIPRPHIAKDMVPGNDGWMSPENEELRKQFYKYPMLFQNLDFTSTPSPITHPNPEFRELVTKYYKMVCELPRSLTQLVLPEIPNMTADELAFVRKYNQERYDI